MYVVNDKDNEMLILEISKSGTEDSEVWSNAGNRKKLTPKRASKAKESLTYITYILHNGHGISK